MRRISASLRASIATYLSETNAESAPKGWYTARQIEKHTGYSQRGTNLLIIKMVTAGDVEIRKYKIRTGQVIRPVPHYRFNQRALKALGLFNK